MLSDRAITKLSDASALGLGDDCWSVIEALFPCYTHSNVPPLPYVKNPICRSL